MGGERGWVRILERKDATANFRSGSPEAKSTGLDVFLMKNATRTSSSDILAFSRQVTL
jgi:hypothetical protein